MDPQRVDKNPPQAVQGLKPGELRQPHVDDSPLSSQLLDNGQRFLASQGGTYQLRRADGSVAKFTVPDLPAIPLAGPWKLVFPRGWDAPESIDLPELIP